MRSCLPNGIVAVVARAFEVGRMEVVDANAGGRDSERVRGATVTKRVERDDQLLGASFSITPSDERANAAGVTAAHPGADV